MRCVDARGSRWTSSTMTEVALYIDRSVETSDWNVRHQPVSRDGDSETTLPSIAEASNWLELPIDPMSGEILLTSQ